MRPVDLESMIEESEQSSTSRMSEAQRLFETSSENWTKWAAAQLEKEEQQRKDMYMPKDMKNPEIVQGYNPLSGLTWKVKDGDNSWLNPPPPSLKAPHLKRGKLLP